MSKMIIQGPKAAPQEVGQEPDTTFYAGISHPLAASMLALIALIEKGEGDTAAHLAQLKEAINTPAFWVGASKILRVGGVSILYPGDNNKPGLNPNSLFVYSDDPTRERSRNEAKGLLCRAFTRFNQGQRQQAVVESNDLWKKIVEQYREEAGVTQASTAGTAIPAGKPAEAMPAGEEEVAPRVKRAPSK